MIGTVLLFVATLLVFAAGVSAAPLMMEINSRRVQYENAPKPPLTIVFAKMVATVLAFCLWFVAVMALFHAATTSMTGGAQ